MTENESYIIWIGTGILLLYILVRILRARAIRNSSLRKIDRMDGLDFERYLMEKYEGLGYRVELTSGSHDFGADLILEKDGIKTVVQAKRYSDKVSIPAVQQVFCAMYYYDAYQCVIVTNNYYTAGAKKLAEKVGVELIDRDDMVELFQIRSGR